jgi:hypothetical protein
MGSIHEKKSRATVPLSRTIGGRRFVTIQHSTHHAVMLHCTPGNDWGR